MQKRTFLQARIDRLLKPFKRDDVPDLVNFVSGVNAPPNVSIDDGVNYDPAEQQIPDFVAKDNLGWK